MLSDKDVQFVDFRFTDSLGNMRHITKHINSISENVIQNGFSFNISQFPMWNNVKTIMQIVPDISTYFIDPFFSATTVAILCDIFDTTSDTYYTESPRYIAKKAEEYLRLTKYIDGVNISIESEFFVFDSIKFESSRSNSSYSVVSTELDSNNNDQNTNPYCSIGPMDTLNEIRLEIANVAQGIGIGISSMSHGNTLSQIKIKISDVALALAPDLIQKYKYIVKNVCASYGRIATFMPKPILNTNGSGMRICQSKISDKKIHSRYLGGIMKHIKALNAFANSTTNSYKRLNSLSYKTDSLNLDFPDGASNPYLFLASMVMAGIDGIVNKIDPNDIGCSSAKSLESALCGLDSDRDFLKVGNVFTDTFIDAFIEHKTKEINDIDTIPTTKEFQMYHAC